jgi:hypothetical protein
VQHERDAGTKAKIRRDLIGLARRRARPGVGSALSLLRRRTALMQWPDLSPILGAIRWAVVGAVATRHYAAERQTRDFDVAIRQADGARARARLRQAGYAFIEELRKELKGAWRSPDGLELDVIELDDPWAAEALEEAQANRDATGLPILPLPYLVLMKLEASRAIDVADLARMLGQAGNDALDRVRSVVSTYRPQDLEDLEHLIYLGKLEVGDSSA